MNKIVLIDGNSLINRAYYAMPKLINKAGKPTGAVYGFLSMLIKLVDEIEPTHIAVAFDLKAPTFRHKMYDEYKAGRHPMPEDLVEQMPLLKEVLASLNIKICELAGYEADDILGTLSVRFPDQTYIISGDKDILQLVSKSTEVWLAKKGITDMDKVTLAGMQLEGFLPHQVIEYKGLAGDNSDNIKGVRGIGEKTARNLLNEYKDIDGIYENIDKIKGKVHDNLVADKESAYFSKKLATIYTEVPIDCTLEDTKFIYPFNEKQLQKLNELEFSSLISRMKFENVEMVEEKQVELKTIENIQELQKVLSKTTDCIAINFDNSITFSLNNEVSYSVSIIEDLFNEGLTYDELISCLKPILEDKSVKKILFGAKDLMHKLSGYNVNINNYFDLLLAGYIIKSKNFTSVEELFSDFNIINPNSAKMFDLYKIELDNLNNENLVSLYEDVEMPLQKILFDMESQGVSIDTTILNRLGEEFVKELASLTDQIFELAGENFNINSPKQLGVILFEKLGLKTVKKTKTGYSTSEEVLLKLEGKHPIIELILRYRKIAKLNSTYIEGMRGLVEGGKIHTTYEQTVTKTGRLSSTNPNLQNIPARDSEGSKIREMFVASEGNTLLSADYSQIELRLLAHCSGDENLIKAYNSEADIHAKTASEIFAVDSKDVTPEMRRSAKAVNFGIIYGISGFGLATNLSIPVYVAQNYIDRYFVTYPKVKEYMESNVKFAKENGYVLTLFNRRRYIAEIMSSNYQVRSFGERAAMNMPLQGSAADLIKMATINVYNRLIRENLKAKLILQIHDELIIDTPLNEVDEVKKILKEEMEGVAKLDVPLIVDIGEGRTWLECKWE